jgi:hypothetical protein
MHKEHGGSPELKARPGEFKVTQLYEVFWKPICSGENMTYILQRVTNSNAYSSQAGLQNE